LISEVVSEILILEWMLLGPIFVISQQSHKLLTTSDLYNFSYITTRDFIFSGFV